MAIGFEPASVYADGEPAETTSPASEGVNLFERFLHFKPKNAVKPAAIIWAGDSPEQLRAALRTAGDLDVTGGPLNLDAVVLAHRLHRPQSAQILLNFGMEVDDFRGIRINHLCERFVQYSLNPRSPLWPNIEGQATVGPEACGQLQQKYYQFWFSLGPQQLLVPSVLRVQWPDECNVLQRLLLAIGPYHAHFLRRWYIARTLGLLLNLFDQDALTFNHRWCALLTHTASALQYPLEKDHLLIGHL